jgi:hypothetical protein
MATLEHEIDEVLGLGSGLDGFAHPLPEDFFRYTSDMVRTYATTGDDAYFSIDGVNALAQFNMAAGADKGDWWSDNGAGVAGGDQVGRAGDGGRVGLDQVVADDVEGS